MTDDIGNFVLRLDELLQKYNDLIAINHDKELKRLLELHFKNTEKIAALETKLQIAKTKLKYEISLRKKAEMEREKLAETLKMLRNTNNSDILSSSVGNSEFVTPLSHTSFESDLNEANSVHRNRREHEANNATFNIPKTNLKLKFKMKLPREHVCPITSQIDGPELSYLGVANLNDKPCPKRLYLTSFNEVREPLVTVQNASSQSLERECQEKPQSCSFNMVSPNNVFKLSKVTSLYKFFDLDKEFSQHYQDGRNISDFTPLIPPMIPSLVIHCINEIENRGLKEIGMYRMPGSEEELNMLRNKFNPTEDFDFSDVNIHSVAAFLKNFLGNHPLIPKSFHHAFVQIIIENDKDELYRAVNILPQANRDTLAYLVVHLKRVVASPGCRMSSSRLSSIFGPIIFGLYRCDKENEGMFDPLISVTEEFLKLTSSYWNSFIVEPSLSETPSKLRNSPSTERILRGKAKKYFTPPARKKKFFTSP